MHRVIRSLWCLLILATGVQAQEEAADVFENVQPGVVAIRNQEGGGTGMIVRADGLILTNAHVISSPFPYECEANVYLNGEEKTVVFKKVRILGAHPTKDMALVQIDPSEHAGELKPIRMSPTKARVGQRVYAIGNPGSGTGGMVLNKTITSGILSGVDRLLEGVSYYQVDAGINPGNSGGPLVNKDSLVIGMVTLKFTRVENIGFAIPLFDIDTSEFIPLSERKGSAEEQAQFKQFAGQGERLFEQAVEKGDELEAKSIAARMIMVYQRMLAEAPGNADLLFKIGRMHSYLEDHKAAVTYFVQAIQADPWSGEAGDRYLELGRVLNKQGSEQRKAGVAALREGIAKFPSRAGKLYAALADYYSFEKNLYEGAYYATIAMHLRPEGVDEDDMQSLIRYSTRRMSPEEKKKFQETTSQLSESLAAADREAEQKRSAQTRFLVPDFEKYLKDSGIQVQTERPKEEKVEIPKLTIADFTGERPSSVAAVPKPSPSPKSAPAAPTPPGGGMDLLPRVQLAPSSKWTLADGVLTTAFAKYSVVPVEVTPPTEYDLTFTIERKSNQNEFVIGFPAGGKHSLLQMDANAGKVSGFQIDGPNVHQGQLIKKNPQQFTLRVRKERVGLWQDGRELFGEPTDNLPDIPAEWSTGKRLGLFLGIQTARFVLRELRLEPVSP